MSLKQPDEAPGKPVKVYTFANYGVNPPGELYVGTGSSLLVNVWTSQATYIAVTGEMLAGNEITAFSEQKAVTLTDQKVTFTIPLREGYLLRFSVYQYSGTNLIRGQCWIAAYIQTFISATVTIQQALFSDYLVYGAALSFPGAKITSPFDGKGREYSVSPADPDLGTDFLYTTPSYRYWLFIGAGLSLDTVGGANRYLLFSFFPSTGSGMVVYSTETPAIPGDTSRGVQCWVRHQAFTVSALRYIEMVNAPERLFLRAGRIGTLTVGLGANDQIYDVIIHVEEWLNPQ